jgi:hypothetical protein
LCIAQNATLAQRNSRTAGRRQAVFPGKDNHLSGEHTAAGKSIVEETATSREQPQSAALRQRVAQVVRQYGQKVAINDQNCTCTRQTKPQSIPKAISMKVFSRNDQNQAGYAWRS